MITLVLDCVDRLNVYNTAAHFSEYAGEEAAESWKEIVNLLYELLGVSICPLSYPFMVKIYQLCFVSGRLSSPLCDLEVLTSTSCLL